jgi:prepilin-type N-terminal cleavage/methylation domain-containing protein
MKFPEATVLPGTLRHRTVGSFPSVPPTSDPPARAWMRRGAFTLVELLVVIAIVGILIALIFPALGNAMNRARQLQCVNNLRGIGQITLYYSQRRPNGRFPSASGHNPTRWWTGDTSLTDIRAIMDELKLPVSIWYCPQLGRQGFEEYTPEHPESMANFTPSSDTVRIGYVYMANPVGVKDSAWHPKWTRDPKFYRCVTESTTAPIATDICQADRAASPSGNPLEAWWLVFPHDGVDRPRVCNTVRMDGSVDAVELKDLAIGFSFLGGTDLYWPK